MSTHKRGSDTGTTALHALRRIAMRGPHARMRMSVPRTRQSVMAKTYCAANGSMIGARP